MISPSRLYILSKSQSTNCYSPALLQISDWPGLVPPTQTRSPMIKSSGTASLWGSGPEIFKIKKRCIFLVLFLVGIGNQICGAVSRILANIDSFVIYDLRTYRPILGLHLQH